MKKLRKNKFVVLTICVIIVSTVYFLVQKVIDNYAFASNSDIVTDGGTFDKESEGGASDKMVNNTEGNLEEILGQISEEEMDFVTEESESGESEEVVEDESEGITSKVDNSESKKDNQSFVEVNKIYVYVTGEVNIPGVVILDEGSRIVDAINAAGGTTTRANISKVNLVYVLEDGMKVNIPSDKELKDNSGYEYITMNSGDGGRDDYSNSYGEDSFEGSAVNNGESKVKDYSIVNINTGTQTELETLPGIGPSLALKIINYRKENGKFSTIEEIKNVSGIGDNKFENIRKYITI